MKTRIPEPLVLASASEKIGKVADRSLKSRHALLLGKNEIPAATSASDSYRWELGSSLGSTGCHLLFHKMHPTSLLSGPGATLASLGPRD